MLIRIFVLGPAMSRWGLHTVLSLMRSNLACCALSTTWRPRGNAGLIGKSNFEVIISVRIPLYSSANRDPSYWILPKQTGRRGVSCCFQ